MRSHQNQQKKLNRFVNINLLTVKTDTTVILRFSLIYLQIVISSRIKNNSMPQSTRLKSLRSIKYSILTTRSFFFYKTAFQIKMQHKGLDCLLESMDRSRKGKVLLRAICSAFFRAIFFVYWQKKKKLSLAALKSRGCAQTT